MKKIQTLDNHLGKLHLKGARIHMENLLQQAQEEKLSYLDFALKIFENEMLHRQTRALQLRIKKAKLPVNHDLSTYDFTAENGITQTQLNQLCELIWLEQGFNILLMGASGTGKTFIAAGLAFQAVKAGYKALFRTTAQIMDTLKMKDITRSAQTEYKALKSAHLVVMDDLMMFPVEKKLANELFHLINHLHEQASLIITTNKSPKQWAEVLQDEVLTTALLDRILYKCEAINLHGKSYRMKNRKSIF